MAIALAACAPPPPGMPREPRAAAAPARPSETLPTDPLSEALAAYYSQIETSRVANRMMRTDSGAAEGPVSASRLANNYMAIALRDEHVLGPAGFGGGAPSVLRRWEVPVTYVLDFGASVSRARQLRDRQDIVHLASRLMQASGHDISVAPAGSPTGSASGNFHVLVVSEAERRAAAPQLRTLVPGIDDASVRLITDMPRDVFCMVLAFSRDGSATYSEAVAIIRAEHPDLTRLACYHEELAQGLGLAADSDRARPSIFNDDQEFALITDHDLLLLKLHYDPRLTPGLTAPRAQSIIFLIASELAAGET